MSWDDEVGAGAEKMWLKSPAEPGPGQVEYVELANQEPVLSALLRIRESDRRVLTVHLVDGSQITGQIEDVSEDGTTAVVVNGRDEYAFDVTALVVVQTRRAEPEKR